MKIHPTLQKVLLVAGALILFIGVTQIFKWYNHFEVNPKAFHSVPDVDSLMAEESLVVPQLKLAYENGLTSPINRTIPLQNLDRTLTIDRLWITPTYGNGNVYILYHMDMHRSDDQPKDIPKFSFSRIVFTAPKGGKLKSEVSLIHKSEGHAYQRNFYRGMVINPEEINAFHNTWFTRKLQSITIQNPRVTSNGQTITLDDITFNINHNYYKQALANVSINRKIRLKDGTVISFQSLEARLNINNLRFSLFSPKDISAVVLAMDGIGKTTVSITQQKNYTARFEPFTESMPKKVGIRLAAVKYKHLSQANPVHDKKMMIPIPSNEKNHPASASAETE